METLYKWLRTVVTAQKGRLMWGSEDTIDEWALAGKRLDQDWIVFVTESEHSIEDINDNRMVYRLALAGCWSNASDPDVAQRIGEHVADVAGALETGAIPATCTRIEIVGPAAWATRGGVTVVALTVEAQLQR